MDSPAEMYQNPRMTLMELPPLTSDEEAELLREIQHWTIHVENMRQVERSEMARLAAASTPEEREWVEFNLALTRRALQGVMEVRHRKAQRLRIGDSFLPEVQH